MARGGAPEGGAGEVQAGGPAHHHESILGVWSIKNNTSKQSLTKPDILSTIVGQYRRLMSTCAVRAQAMCTLARVGLITPAARDAARRRQVAMRMEEQMRKERRAQWMASLQGPGWARRGRCHGL